MPAPMGHPAVTLFAAALVIAVFLAPGRRTRAILLGSFAGLLLALAGESPARPVGDAGEYLAMAVNLGRLSKPSLTAADLAADRTIVPGDAGVRLEKPAFRAADGRQDFPHFWLYSLLAAPFVRAAGAIGAHPLTGFTVLNFAMLLCGAALLAARASPAAALLVMAGPIVWWVDKAHTEVLTSVLLAAALALIRTSPWWSILALGVATAQNIALLSATVVVIACALYQAGWRNRRVWIASAAAGAMVALQPLYYQMRLGIWTGLYDAIDRHLPSFRELTAVLFDPNLGILIHDPLLLIAIAIASVEAVTRPGRKPFDAVDGAIALAALALIVSFTQTTNVNSGGTPGPSRYGLWLVPFAVPLLAGVRPDANWLRVLAGGSIVWCAWAFAPSLPDQYLKPSSLAAALWARWPDLDNPLAEVFAERTAAREPARPPAATDGCEKVLLVGDGTGAAWPSRCTAATLPGFCQTQDALCYANKTADGYRFVPASATPAWRVAIGLPDPFERAEGMLVITQSAEPRFPMAIWHDEGWSYAERLAEPTPNTASLEWRWIDGRARVGVMTSEPVRARLKITARSFNRARRLKVSVGNADVGTLLVAESPAEYQTSGFDLPAGTDLITLEALEPGETPGTADPRLLSVAVFRIELVAARR